MNILVWNCRGTSQKGFTNLVRDLRKENNTSFVCLMETHSSGKSDDRIIKRMNMDRQFLINARGQVGGIWCFWDPNLWKVEVMQHVEQFVHMKVRWKKSDPCLL